MEEKSEVALVLTAGALREIFDKSGKRLPFWCHWPFLKSLIKKWEEKGKVTIVHREELKGETISRLEKSLELFGSGAIQKIICAGGYSPKRRRLGLKDSVTLMSEWLWANGVRQRVMGEAMSVDTAGNIEEFIGQLKKLLVSQKLTVYLVTSWYHQFRAKWELKTALERKGLSATIISIPVFPRCDAESLRYEYLWNLLSEPAKILMLAFPRIKNGLRNKELKTRM